MENVMQYVFYPAAHRPAVVVIDLVSETIVEVYYW